MAVDLLPPGTLIADRYCVARALAGGMGIVYLCTDQAENGFPVALKTFRPEFLPDREARGRFLREGATWVNLGRHQHIVRAYRVERVGDGRQVYLVLERVDPPPGLEEPSLRGRLVPGQPLPLEQALLFALHVARGMRYVTTRLPDLVHRDLKPENVLIGQDGNARVTDFGLAMTLVGLDVAEAQWSGSRFNGAGRSFVITNKGILGTPLYMAPEQWTPGEKLDARSDIYAFGGIVYEMLAGKPAFWGQDIDELEQAHRAGRVGRLPKGLPAAVCALVWRCLDPDRERRFRTWEEVERAVADSYSAALGKKAPPGKAAPEETRYERVAAGWSYNTIGMSYYDIGRYDMAVTCFEQAVRAGQAEKEAPLECAGLLNLGNTYRTLGSFQRAIELLQDALALAHGTGDRHSEQQFLHTLGDVYRTFGEGPRSIEFYERSLAIARELGDRGGEALAQEKMGAALADLGDLRRATRLHGQALEIARELGDQRLEGHVLCRLADCRLAESQARQSMELYEAALKIAWSIGDLPGQAQAMSGLGQSSMALGDTAQAVDLLQRSLAITQEIGDRTGSVFNLLGLGRAYRAAGDALQAIGVLENALALARKLGLRVDEMRVLRDLGALHLDVGQPRRALKVADEYVTVAGDLGDWREECWALRYLGQAHHQVGDYREAVECLGKWRVRAREHADRAGEARALNALGEVFADLGDVRESIELFEGALRAARRAHDTSTVGRAGLNLARQWMRAGRRRAARRSAQAAEKALRIAGLLAEARQAQELAEEIENK